jgi:acetyl esterase/lipase
MTISQCVAIWKSPFKRHLALGFVKNGRKTQLQGQGQLSTHTPQRFETIARKTLLAQEQLAASAQPCPEVAAFFKAHPMPTANTDDPDVMKERFAMMENRMLSDLGPAPPGISDSYQTITLRDGYSSTIKIIRPTTSSSVEPGPLIPLVHAGGFVDGSVDQLTPDARTSAQLFSASVVLVSYRQAPEYNFPKAPQLDV